uniref:ABC transporter domain-containing protein n=1 Tax=Oryzias sinensis TaxID=183150 RepID=A0A8C8A2J4_9TELE
MGLLTQFSLLLWKNFTLRKRQKVRLLVEILWPLFLFVILVAVRTTTKPVNKGQCHYPNKAMPSAGLLPWLQGMMCNIDNPCYNDPTPGETPGQVNNFNNSIVSQILINVQNLLLELSNGKAYATFISKFRPKTITFFALATCTHKEVDPRGCQRFLSCPGPKKFVERRAFKFNQTAVGGHHKEVHFCLGQVFILLANMQNVSRLVLMCFSLCLSWHHTACFSALHLPSLLCVELLNHVSSKKQMFSFKLTLPVSSPDLLSLDPFCTTLIDTMVTTPSMQFLWKNFRPLLKGKVLYTPDTPAARLLVEEVRLFVCQKEFADSWGEDGPFVWDYVENITAVVRFHKCFELNKFEAVPTEYQLVTKALEHLENDTFWAGIVFENLQPNSSSIPPYLKYKIRMDVEEVQRTDKVENRLWSPGANANPYENLRYIWGGFAYLEDIIDHASIRLQTSTSQPLGVYVQQMPYPCYVDDPFLRALAGFLPLFMTIAWIFSVALIIKGIVGDKESRLKETVRIMGLRGEVYWLTWLLTCLLPMATSSVLLTIVIKYGKVLQYSDPSVVFVFLLVFCLSTISQCFLISVFFSKANLAAACGGLIYFLLYLPHVLCYAWRDVMGFEAKVGVSLLSCVAFGYGCENLSKFEEQGVGIQWHNIAMSPEEGQRYTFIVSILMMLLDAVIYWVLTWYIENVFPGQYGIPRPWYFLFTYSYWFGKTSKPDPSMKAGVSIRNLVKIYKTGKKVAVDGLSVDFYENQITSFLGHNGAGKTTTMSILTGLFPPTSGTALINGHDIRTDMDSIRKYLGMCPQHNVLFDELTVEEHIYFYGRLKGLNPSELQTEMDQMIKDVGLLHKRKDLVKNLSGGMQRKLSVAIAFVGGSKIVILDEPTAGVDPFARRGIWDLLLKYKKGRTIILSTHHMDEADILGDRIAIISHGKMRCCGSSIFLKKSFGSGYYLTLVRSGTEVMTAQRSALDFVSYPKIVHKRDANLSVKFELLFLFFDKEFINFSRQRKKKGLASVEFVRRHVPEAVFLESIGKEITFILPYARARDGTFATLFQELDQVMDKLGLTSYGVSDTTLEEIFLKVAEDTGVDKELSHFKKSASVNGRGSVVITGWKLIRQQFLALFIKRFHHARRSRKGLIAQVVLPAIFVCLALVFSLIVPSFTAYPSLELQPWMYDSQTTFYSNDMPEDANVSRVVETLVDNPGFGTRCMEGNPIPRLPCSSGASDWFSPSVDQSVADIFLNGNWSMSNPSPSCQCSTPGRTIIMPDCPPGAGGLPPPQVSRRLRSRGSSTFDSCYLNLNLTFVSFRYGGISVGGINSQVLLTEVEIEEAFAYLGLPGYVWKHFNFQFEFKDHRTELCPLKVWFYNKGWHSMVSFLSVVNNGILRGYLPEGQDLRQYGLSVSNHPLNLSKEQLSLSAMATTSSDVVVSICVIFAMSFIPASFVLFLIQERVSKAKHLQFVSGVNPVVYWVASFVWDICNYIIPCFLVVVIFICFQQKAYVSPQNLPALILLLVMYGWAITPMMYPASFIFTVPSTAYVVLTCLNLFIGINGSVATFVMELFKDEVTCSGHVDNTPCGPPFSPGCPLLGGGGGPLPCSSLDQPWAGWVAAWSAERVSLGVSWLVPGVGARGCPELLAGDGVLVWGCGRPSLVGPCVGLSQRRAPHK